MICSPSLSREDIDAMEDGYAARGVQIERSILADVQYLLDNPNIRNHASALATLISSQVVDIKIAHRPSPLGPYHEKLGIFSDGADNIISFKGSANETWSGWHEEGNFESIEVFCSWMNSSDQARTTKHQEYFNRLWLGEIANVHTYDFPEAARLKLCEIAKDTLDDVDWDRIASRKAQRTNTKENQVESRPKKRTPFPHQIEAIRNWEANNYRGVLEHATGSGKTYTALTALKAHLKSSGVGLILVPSSLLLKQWAEEVKDELPNATLLKAGDGNVKWRKSNRLASFTADDPKLGMRVVIATLQTASSDEFIKKMGQGTHVMVIGDECHQSGSQKNSKVYQIDAGKRLGLSATPRRYGDPEGTEQLFNYFGPAIDPIFTLNDAIKAGRLVRYDYFPHEITLTPAEAEEWKEFSDKIKKAAARSPRDGNGKILPSSYLEILTLNRARIAKKAARKSSLATSIIRDEYLEGEKWLVYCEDQHQLADVLRNLNDAGYSPIEYHTAMAGDAASTLNWYRKHGGILVSIRCLDEGIDIPDITHAIILASSQNPRQFIQRRGRVLRVFEGKHKAVIHDAIVVPDKHEVDDAFSSLIQAEICRAIEFAENSFNRSAAADLSRIAIDMGLEVHQIANTGMEGDS